MVIIVFSIHSSRNMQQMSYVRLLVDPSQIFGVTSAHARARPPSMVLPATTPLAYASSSVEHSPNVCRRVL